MRAEGASLETIELVEDSHRFARIKRNRQIRCGRSARKADVGEIDAFREDNRVGSIDQRQAAEADLDIDEDRLLIDGVVAEPPSEVIGVVAVETDQEVIAQARPKDIVVAEAARHVVAIGCFRGDQHLLNVAVGIDIAIVAERENLDP